MEKRERFRKAAGMTAIAVLAVMFTGCKYAHQRDLEITSSPKGAKVEINGQYLGETPMKYKVSSENTDTAVIEFVLYPNPPIYTPDKLYMQKKTVAVELIPEDELTELDLFKVYFDMGYRELSPETLSENYNYNYEIKK
ncbi:MAG TPA: PEGA domain-containing protein [Candidatus Goldiibacteriota bacterium]|nr:PEGA domain-containing protein [Candidatus Goldiibacteriota bacterium]